MFIDAPHAGHTHLVIQVIVTLVDFLQPQVPLAFYMDVRIKPASCCLHQLHVQSQSINIMHVSSSHIHITNRLVFNKIISFGK